MATREQNERRFKNWQDLPDGTRRYWTDRKGAVSGFQRMVKIVDANEITLQLVQEIYNDDEVMIERHQKYPVDTGHEKLVDED
jgi:hypothetical protein